ncbi:MAG: hypothetical protein ABF379_13170, partial [Akkermansiaceae bacterium]
KVRGNPGWAKYMGEKGSIAYENYKAHNERRTHSSKPTRNLICFITAPTIFLPAYTKGTEYPPQSVN